MRILARVKNPPAMLQGIRSLDGRPMNVTVTVVFVYRTSLPAIKWVSFVSRYIFVGVKEMDVLNDIAWDRVGGRPT